MRHRGELNQNIAPQVGLHYNNVATRSQFLAALPALRKIETDAPESFARKVNEICGLYQSAWEQSREGAHIVSTDEMTGIQALEHKYPDKLPLPGQCAKMEFEYIRHGTTSLIGFFDVAAGRLEVPYLNSTHTEEDFVEAVKALAGTDPQAPWTFICDGLNTHKSEALIRFAAEACALGVELGKKGKTGILKSMESRADFLHDPSHLSALSIL